MSVGVVLIVDQINAREGENTILRSLIEGNYGTWLMTVIYGTLALFFIFVLTPLSLRAGKNIFGPIFKK